MSKDYHDYVIKNGELIGQFEEMYKECDDPWHQKISVIQFHKMSCMGSIEMLNSKRVLEIGCGLGYLTSFYNRVFPNVKIDGMDISISAIEKARKQFPNINFICADIAKDLNLVTEYDTIIFSEILWYILPNLNAIVGALKKNFLGKYILINQSFYDINEQKYGKEYFTDPKGVIDFFDMELINLVIAQSTRSSGCEAHIALMVK